MATKSPTSSLLFPYDSSDEESIEQLSDREDQSEVSELQPEFRLQQDASEPTDDEVYDDDTTRQEQAEVPVNTSTSTAVVKTATKRKNPYALGFHQLPLAFQKFLAEVKSFFTQKVNLQRQRAAISASTYAKVQERILCKFHFFIILLF